MTVRRLQPLPTLRDQLAAGIAARTGGPPPEAQRMAEAILQDVARPVAEALGDAWRATVDHVLFDTPLEAVRPGEEQVSTEIYGLVLDIAAAQLTGWAAALEMANDHSRRAPAAPPPPTAVVLQLPARRPEHPALIVKAVA